VRRAAFALLLLFVLACSRGAPDATPEGAVRLFVEKMESGADDSRAMREAYQLLGPRAKNNLKERAERASRGQGRHFEPYEMLAEGRFGLKFRPKTLTARVVSDEAFVDVAGDRAEDHATVRCIRDGGGWRVELELPDVTQPTRRGDGGT
jgi:hypothetical protein